jgi:hypothetical protein
VATFREPWAKDSLTRSRLRKGYRKENLTRIGKIPATKAELLLMALRFKVFQRDRSMVLVTEGLGSQPFHGRTVLLINEHSHSAAEMVASIKRGIQSPSHPSDREYQAERQQTLIRITHRDRVDITSLEVGPDGVLIWFISGQGGDPFLAVIRLLP